MILALPSDNSQSSLEASEPELDEMRLWWNEMNRRARNNWGCDCQTTLGFTDEHKARICTCWCCGEHSKHRELFIEADKQYAAAAEATRLAEEEREARNAIARRKHWEEFESPAALARIKARDDERKAKLREFEERIWARREERVPIEGGARLAIEGGSARGLAVPAPPGKPARQERGIIASGIELELALHGSHKEVMEYVDLVGLVHGRSAEMHAADVITCEQKTRELNRLVAEHRLLNNSNPGGQGTDEERIGALRTLIADVSQSGLEGLLDDGTIYTWRRELWEYDPSASPPCQRLDNAPRLRDALMRLAPTRYDCTWEIYVRHADLCYTDHIPGSTHGVKTGFTPFDGVIYYQGHKATAAELKLLDGIMASTPLPGNVVTIPDIEPIGALDGFLDKELTYVIKVGKVPGAVTRDEVQECYAADGGEGFFDAEEADRPVTALVAGRPVLALEMSWAQKIASLAPWKGALSELASETGWTGSIQSFSGEVRRITPELLSRGIIIRKTGGRCCGRLRLEEWAVEKILAIEEG